MSSLRLKWSDIFISFFSILTSIEPYRYLLIFLFLQPFLGFTRNEDLDLLKHLFYRIFSLSLLLYTLFFISYQKGKIVLHKSGLEKYLLMYIASITISTVFAISSGEATFGRSVTSLLTVPILISLLYTISYWFDDIKKIIKAIRYFLLSVVIVCIIGIFEFIILSISGGDSSIRINSVFVDPNIFARYVLLGIFFIVPFIFFKDNTIFRRRTLFIFITMFLLSLLLSLSRSGYLTLIAGGIFFALFLDNKKIKSFVISGSIIVGLIIFAYLFTQRSFSGTAIVEPSNLNRVQLIFGGIDMIQSNWFLGVGYTNFAAHFEKHYLENILSISTESYKYAGFATEIHNWVVEVWAEQGIVGLIIFSVLFYKIFQLFNKAKKNETEGTTKNILLGFILMFFIFLFHGFFYHTFISQFLFWVLSGFGVATVIVSTSKSKN
jgi:putative inorganic carbon (HCO3(-)) transporter